MTEFLGRFGIDCEKVQAGIEEMIGMKFEDIKKMFEDYMAGHSDYYYYYGDMDDFTGKSTLFNKNIDCRKYKFLAPQYCLEIQSAGNIGNDLLILRNDQEIDTLQRAFEDYYRCFDKNDEPNIANDIFEIRHSNGDDGVNLHISIVDEETRTELLFGLNADQDSIFLDSSYGSLAGQSGDGHYCLADGEGASSIKFQNGVIIESECIKPS